MTEPMSETILQKLVEGDISIWITGQPGVGLDWCWVDLTQEEAEYLAEMAPDRVYNGPTL